MEDQPAGSVILGVDLTSEEAFDLAEEVLDFIGGVAVEGGIEETAGSVGKFVFEESHDGFDDRVDLGIVDPEGGEFFFEFVHDEWV